MTNNPLQAEAQQPSDGLVEQCAKMADGLRGSMWANRNEIIALLDLASAALKTRTSPERWQPIETAPRDGSTFDVWIPSYADPGSGYRVANLRMTPSGTLFRQGETFPADLAHWPTHWRPLPEPPAHLSNTPDQGSDQHG